MGEFFHGWKRKLGCVTLMMALVAMGGWVSSLRTSDSVVVAFGMISLELQSEHGMLELMLHRISVWNQGDFGIEQTYWHSEELPVVIYGENGEQYIEGIKDTYLDWRHNKKVEFLGFMFSSGEMTGDSRSGSRVQTNVFAFPYWSITVPLSLISLWLLLSKPRKMTQMKTAD